MAPVYKNHSILINFKPRISAFKIGDYKQLKTVATTFPMADLIANLIENTREFCVITNYDVSNNLA
jgi:hypothetical protein